MKRFSVATVLILFLFLNMSTHQLYGQQSDKINFEVQVIVQADESLKTKITSFITREIRSLGDVGIIGEEAHWKLMVLALQIRTNAGATNNIAIATSVKTRLSHHSIIDIVKRNYKLSKIENSISSLEKNIGWMYLHDFTLLNVCSMNDLKSTCEDIVAHFDVHCFENVRKMMMKYK